MVTAGKDRAGQAGQVDNLGHAGREGQGRQARQSRQYRKCRARKLGKGMAGVHRAGEFRIGMPGRQCCAGSTEKSGQGIADRPSR